MLLTELSLPNGIMRGVRVKKKDGDYHEAGFSADTQLGDLITMR